MAESATNQRAKNLKRCFCGGRAPRHHAHPNTNTHPNVISHAFILGVGKKEQLCGTMKSATLCLVLPALTVVAVALWLQRLVAEPLQVHDPASPAYLQKAIHANPSNGRLQAQLALSLLAPVEAVAPNADDESLHGGEFTLYHPNMVEARAALDKALKSAPTAIETHMAHTAVLMTEGRGEDAIQPARAAAELAPKWPRAHIDNARAHLLAACAQACEARESLRTEKRAEKKAGKKSALEEREEQAQKQQDMKEAREGGGAKPMAKDRGSLRAGSMWRVMEAGRILQTASLADPKDAEARRLARLSKRLTALDAHQVSTTEALVQFGECHWFFGQELDGHQCDKRRHKYE